MTEQRKFTRVPFIARAELITEDQTFEAHVIDLSLQGALVSLAHGDGPQLYDELTLKLHLNDRLTLSFLGKLVHHQSSAWGIKFIAEDLDSFTHLRRICEMNSLDPESIQGELAFLAEG